MERASILRLLRFPAIRAQYITSSNRYLSTFARQQDGLFRYPAHARSAPSATKRYPAPLFKVSTRSYSTPSDPTTEVSNIPSQEASDIPSQEPSHKRTVEPRRDAQGLPLPTYELTFTCKPCQHRSAHMITKLSYHHGAVLIQCPNCKARHVISDHLRIFSDEKNTIESILKKKGQYVKRGTVDGDGDVELWKDAK